MKKKINIITEINRICEIMNLENKFVLNEGIIPTIFKEMFESLSVASIKDLYKTLIERGTGIHVVDDMAQNASELYLAAIGDYMMGCTTCRKYVMNLFIKKGLRTSDFFAEKILESDPFIKEQLTKIMKIAPENSDEIIKQTLINPVGLGKPEGPLASIDDQVIQKMKEKVKSGNIANVVATESIVSIPAAMQLLKTVNDIHFISLPNDQLRSLGLFVSDMLSKTPDLDHAQAFKIITGMLDSVEEISIQGLKNKGIALAIKDQNEIIQMNRILNKVRAAIKPAGELTEWTIEMAAKAGDAGTSLVGPLVPASKAVENVLTGAGKAQAGTADIIKAILGGISIGTLVLIVGIWWLFIRKNKEQSLPDVIKNGYKSLGGGATYENSPDGLKSYLKDLFKGRDPGFNIKQVDTYNVIPDIKESPNGYTVEYPIGGVPTKFNYIYNKGTWEWKQ